MGCCDDPTEAVKINRNDLIRVQQQYGNLLRDLLTSDPDKVMLKQVVEANTYLRQLETNNPPTLLAFLSVLGLVSSVT